MLPQEQEQEQQQDGEQRSRSMVRHLACVLRYSKQVRFGLFLFG
jgi:hypothetical protein